MSRFGRRLHALHRQFEIVDRLAAVVLDRPTSHSRLCRSNHGSRRGLGVIGEAIFGGWGRNVVSGAVATLAFLFFSFPEIRHEPASAWIALACVPLASSGRSA